MRRPKARDVEQCEPLGVRDADVVPEDNVVKEEEHVDEAGADRTLEVVRVAVDELDGRCRHGEVLAAGGTLEAAVRSMRNLALVNPTGEFRPDSPLLGVLRVNCRDGVPAPRADGTLPGGLPSSLAGGRWRGRARGRRPCRGGS